MSFADPAQVPGDRHQASLLAGITPIAARPRQRLPTATLPAKRAITPIAVRPRQRLPTATLPAKRAITPIAVRPRLLGVVGVILGVDCLFQQVALT